MTILRIAACGLVGLLPWFLKGWVYRCVFGYTIDAGVRIGFGTFFIGVRRCHLGKGTRIGPFNFFWCVKEVDIGERVRIGSLNLFRGGDRIEIGPCSTILRCNVFNSILHPDVVNPLTPVLRLGEGTIITTTHWLDFTDQIDIGEHTILGGRNSSVWTHSRQRTKPVRIGARCYLGSEIRVAPGVEVPSMCIVALGAVLMGRFTEPKTLIGGNPAKVLRPLGEKDMFFVTHRTRKDLPDAALEGDLAGVAPIAPVGLIEMDADNSAEIGDPRPPH